MSSGLSTNRLEATREVLAPKNRPACLFVATAGRLLRIVFAPRVAQWGRAGYATDFLEKFVHATQVLEIGFLLALYVADMPPPDRVPV